MFREERLAALIGRQRGSAHDLAEAILAAVAEFAGPQDERTCPLCAQLAGMRVKVGSDEYYRYSPPVHINCRHQWVYYPEGEVEPDFATPDPELVRKHGHFVTQPHKYAPLRVPASPTGRDFVFRRGLDPKTGQMVSRIEYLRSGERAGIQRVVSPVAGGGTVPPTPSAKTPEVQEFVRAVIEKHPPEPHTTGNPWVLGMWGSEVGKATGFLERATLPEIKEAERQLAITYHDYGTLRDTYPSLDEPTHKVTALGWLREYLFTDRVPTPQDIEFLRSAGLRITPTLLRRMQGM